MATAHWRIELMGGLRVTGHGVEIDRFRTQKTAALLAFLAYHSSRGHSRELLTEMFWPDDAPEAARHKLSVALSSLRQQLEPPGVPDQSVLVSDRSTVRLNPAAVETDVGLFESALGAAQAPEPEERLRQLQRAAEAYGGTLLPGQYEDWILPEQRRLEALYFESLRRLLPLLAAAGELPAALQYALRAVAVDPLREESHRWLIHLYDANRQPEAALRQYLDLRRLLKSALGAVPSEETRALTRGIQERLNARDPDEEPEIGPTAEPASAPEAPGEAAREDQDPVGGAVPLDSPFYVTRPPDPLLARCIALRTSIVLLQGPRQVGKTSMLARGLQGARAGGSRVVCTDLELFNSDQLRSAEAFLQAVARSICEQLDFDGRTAEWWYPDDGPNMNFRRFMRRVIDADRERPLVWALDDVDRLLTCPFGGEVFALLRAWHNERALDPGAPWSRLTLVIAYATEARLFITDLNQSPFNVGTRLALEDFSVELVAGLNRAYGSPLRDRAELAAFHRLVGGHPYLVRRGLQEMTSRPLRLGELEAQADREDGVFGDHLNRIRKLLMRTPDLEAAAAQLLSTGRLPDAESFYHLRSAGVVAGDSWEEARPRCDLYARYLARHLPSVRTSGAP